MQLVWSDKQIKFGIQFRKWWSHWRTAIYRGKSKMMLRQIICISYYANKKIPQNNNNNNKKINCNDSKIYPNQYTQEY